MALDEPAIEAAYWEFDARRNGLGEWKDTPQNERAAFKFTLRSLTAPQPESLWQPIETAPRDGTRILVLLKPWQMHEPFEGETDWRDIARWTDHNGGGWVHYTIGTPVMWQPLPAPPTQKEDGHE